MWCPECKTVGLLEKQVPESEVHVNLCPECKGCWFDEKELEKLLPLAIRDLKIPASADKIERFCPNCVLEMLYAFQYPQTDVTVDACRKCRGLWLDGGEARRIHDARAALGDDLQEVDDRPETGPVVRFFARLWDFACRYGQA